MRSSPALHASSSCKRSISHFVLLPTPPPSAPLCARPASSDLLPQRHGDAACTRGRAHRRRHLRLTTCHGSSGSEQGLAGSPPPEQRSVLPEGPPSGGQGAGAQGADQQQAQQPAPEAAGEASSPSGSRSPSPRRPRPRPLPGQAHAMAAAAQRPSWLVRAWRAIPRRALKAFFLDCWQVLHQLTAPTLGDALSRLWLILAVSLVMIVIITTIDSSCLWLYVARARRLA